MYALQSFVRAATIVKDKADQIIVRSQGFIDWLEYPTEASVLHLRPTADDADEADGVGTFRRRCYSVNYRFRGPRSLLSSRLRAYVCVVIGRAAASV